MVKYFVFDNNEKPMSVENENRKFEYDEDTMTLTIIDKYFVDEKDIQTILENIKKNNK